MSRMRRVVELDRYAILTIENPETIQAGLKSAACRAAAACHIEGIANRIYVTLVAYLAVEQNDTLLMSLTVQQCGLQRAVLKGKSLSWQHIIGPQSQDTGLWSTSNEWAGYGMVRVLHTLQKWRNSASMTSQATQLKGWIKEILDGGLLRNYLDDSSWFGEISGTSVLSAVAYRIAVNDSNMFA